MVRPCPGIVLTTDASLSEYFYGLRLVPDHIPTQRLGSIQPVKTPRLSSRQRWGMLVVLVGIPYLRARLDDAYDRWSAQEDPELAPEDQIELNTAQRTFVRLYPWLSTAFEASLLAYDLAYLFNRTPYFRPWHKLLGVRVERRVDEDDPNAAKSILQKFPPLLPPLLLALKFAQWWYSPVSPRSLPTTKETTSQHTSVLPPRPLPILPDAGLLSEEDKEAAVEGYSINPESFGHCPICKGKWQNPAILPSGWVVCWRCGWDAISGEGEKGEEGKGRCPITGVAVHPSELRRVLV